MPTPASPAGTWCNHTLERKRSTLGRSSGEAFCLAAVSFLFGLVRTTKNSPWDMVVSLIFRGSQRGYSGIVFHQRKKTGPGKRERARQGEKTRETAISNAYRDGDRSGIPSGGKGAGLPGGKRRGNCDKKK